MFFRPLQTAHLLFALALLLAAAHAFGYAFRKFRQPGAIGEIVGGLVLGPTVLGAFWPKAYHAIFGQIESTRTVLAAVYELGLLLLMFCAGSELRAEFGRAERRTVAWISIVGTLLPFAFGLAIMGLVDVQSQLGPVQSRPAFVCIFGIAVAITSIPIISRILGDLGLLSTEFARIVLATAVIEDILLYVVLAIALSMVGGHGGEEVGLGRMLALQPGSTASIAYHTVATLAFLAFGLGIGPLLYHRIAGLRYNLLEKSSPVAHLLAFMLLMTGLALILGVASIFGAFVAGIIAGKAIKPPAGSPLIDPPKPPAGPALIDPLKHAGNSTPWESGSAPASPDISKAAGSPPAITATRPARPPADISHLRVTRDASHDAPRDAIKSFAFAFFIPIYFAIVGLRLDLVRSFDLTFFVGFLVAACAAKAISVYFGARAAREPHFASLNFAVAMNARGGPGIVLASVAFDAGIVSESFYVALVMLAVVTSLIAGSWLGFVVRRGWALR